MRTDTVMPPATARRASTAGPTGAATSRLATTTGATADPSTAADRRTSADPDPRRGPAAGLVVREPSAMDQVELRDLARRVGEPVPQQPVVVAAVDGRVVAARSVPSGVLVLDPDAAPEGVGDALRRFARRR